MKILQPPGWSRPKGYSNGVVAEGRMIFLAGIVGWNEREEFEASDFIGQARQALANIVALLAEAEARPEHLVRLTWYVGDAAEYRRSQQGLGVAYREVMGRTFPPMTAVQVAGFVEPGARLEIEATAVLPAD